MLVQIQLLLSLLVVQLGVSSSDNNSLGKLEEYNINTCTFLPWSVRWGSHLGVATGLRPSCWWVPVWRTCVSLSRASCFERIESWAIFNLLGGFMPLLYMREIERSSRWRPRSFYLGWLSLFQCRRRLDKQTFNSLRVANLAPSSGIWCYSTRIRWQISFWSGVLEFFLLREEIHDEPGQVS